MFGIISVMAEFERGLIQERVKAGMRAAKAKGHLPGRKRQKIGFGRDSKPHRGG